MQILMAMGTGDHISASTPMDKEALMAHVNAGKAGIVIAQYGQDDDEQVWGELIKYESPVHNDGVDCAYGFWTGGGWVAPVNGLDEAIAMITSIATDILADADADAQ